MNRRAMNLTSRIRSFAMIFAATLMLAACGPAQEPLDQAPLAGATIGGDFTLADKSGKAVRWADFKGKWRIVYFGFTFCPDACPTDVQRLMNGFALYARSEPKLAKQVQPIFITIDPARDTPARVGEFAAAFSPDLMGLTGTPEQIAAATKAFAVYSARGENIPGGYLMDHSRNAYLFDPEGKPIALLPIDKDAKTAPKAIAAELIRWVR